MVDLAVLRRGGNVMLRGLGDCRFEDANEPLGLDGGDDVDRRVQRDVGGRERVADAGLRRLPRAGHASDCDDSRWCGRRRRVTLRRRRFRSAPGYCTLSILFSDWSRVGPSATCA